MVTIKTKKETKDLSWATKLGFIFAAMGSAIGLGNIWRFPGTAYENGGGSFLIPYIIALIFVGIPLLLFELYLGYYTKKAAPNAFAQIKKPLKILGYLALFSGILVVTYYTVIIAWTLVYTLSALFNNLSVNLFSDLIKSGSALFTGDFNKLGLIYVFSLLSVWLLAALILIKKIKGIEKVNLVFIPLMWIIMVLFLIESLLLPGSFKGIVQYLTPNFEALKDPKVWIAAFGQIFFSLSLGFGIMTAYAKYLKKHKIEGSKAIALGNSSFELLAGFVIFGILGFLITNLGLQSISQLSEKNLGYTSVSLSFKTIPTIIQQMPLSYLFGVLFFFLLFIAGLTSLISLIEAFTSALEEDLNIKRNHLILLITALGFLSGIVYIYNINILDRIDSFVNYLLVFVGFIEVIVIGWLFDKIKESKEIWVKIGKFISPVLLFLLLFTETLKRLGLVNLNNNYYPPIKANFFTYLALLIILGIVFWYVYDLINVIKEELKLRKNKSN